MINHATRPHAWIQKIRLGGGAETRVARVEWPKATIAWGPARGIP